MEESSQAIGWAIRQIKDLSEPMIANILPKVREKAPHMEARQLQAYACLYHQL